MVPADYKEWWLTAVALAATAGPAVGQQPEKVGVVTGQQGVSHSLGTPGAPGERVLYLGESTYRSERIKSEANASTHLMFLDQSSLTIGPNAEIVLDEFVYNPQARTGSIKLSLLRGVVRVVGGEISKTNATVVASPLATIGIRGGISAVEHQDGKTSAVFLFGEEMQVSGPDGQNTQSVTRQGFGVDVTGSEVSPPRQFPSTEISQLVSQLEGQPNGQQTGSSQPGGAPAGQLLSTGNRTEGTQDPGGTLSGDRLDQSADRLNAGDTQRNPGGGALQTVNDNTLRNVLNTTPTNQS